MKNEEKKLVGNRRKNRLQGVIFVLTQARGPAAQDISYPKYVHCHSFLPQGFYLETLCLSSLCGETDKKSLPLLKSN